jgi:aminopeptidase N
MAISIEAPRPLVVASNGRLREVTETPSTRTYHWFVSTPINNYGVTLNAAPYEQIERTYTSVTGEAIPVTYWVLPSNLEKGRTLMDQILEHLAFFEEQFGPYPFRADKYGVAETPYLGMEHQTIIAYGADYQNNQFGFDFLHHHELAHEWWGNMVTAYDWKDFWIHEGFGTYTQALYAGELNGPSGYHGYLRSVRGYLNNAKPVAPRTSRTTKQMYFLSAAGQQSDNDIYYKGAWILHTLRYLIGDEAFFASLRRFAYPDSSLRRATGGEQTRFVTTADYRHLVETITGRELRWFFDLYLRQPALPHLVMERSSGTLELRWETPSDLPFPMPVEVAIGGSTRRVEMNGGTASVSIPDGASVEVDPSNWILKRR